MHTQAARAPSRVLASTEKHAREPTTRAIPSTNTTRAPLARPSTPRTATNLHTATLLQSLTMCWKTHPPSHTTRRARGLAPGALMLLIAVPTNHATPHAAPAITSANAAPAAFADALLHAPIGTAPEPPTSFGYYTPNAWDPKFRTPHLPGILRAE